MTLVRRDTPPPDNPDDEEILHRLGGVMPGKRLPAKRTPAEPAIPEPAELEPVEGEVVDEQPPIRVQSRRLPASVQKLVSGKTAERAGTTAIGMARLSGKGWDGASHGVLRRQIKGAEVAKNSEELKEWVKLLEEAKQRRHDRLRHLPGMAFGFFGMAVLAVFAACFMAFLWALFAPLMWGWSFTGTFAGGLRLVGYGVVTFTVLLFGILGLSPFVMAAVAYREGRKVGSAAGWVTVNRAAGDADEVIVTPAGVAEAINHLSIPALDRAVRDGWRTEFDTPPTRVNNRGYETVFSVPLGVTPDMIADKRGVLARNLHRDPMEVWPTAAARPGFVAVWVADSGSAARPTPEYPLLHDGRADVFEGVPVGVSQRGDEILFPIVGANWVAGGQMGQGKSNLCRVVMLGCATDPLPDLWVHVFAGNGDFDAYRPRLSRYLRGADDDIVWAGLQSLQELYEETGRREAYLASIGAKKVTRGVAEKHPDLRPIVSLFSECHELFGSEIPLYDGAPKSQTVGRAATEFATKTLRRARKTGITLGFDTQSSRADAIPPKIVELVGVNACFSVKTWRSNDGFLGDGSFQAGIRATELRFNVDRGTCLVTGASDEVFEIVKTFFIAVDDEAGRDDATPVIARCMAEVKDAHRLGGAEQPKAIESRDLLEDVAAVLGDQPVPASEVPALLKKLAPRWAPYQRLNGKQLRERLDDEYGYVVPSTGNRWPVSPDSVRAVLSDRRLEEADLTE